MELPCVVEWVIYPQKDKLSDGFALFSASLNADSSKYNVELEDMVRKNCKLSDSGNFTVSINIYHNEDVLGKQFIFVGDFFSHKKYGGQFKSTFYYEDIPDKDEGFRRALMCLPNIKEARSLDIIKTFGVQETKRILNEEPKKLLEINGITEERLKTIKAEWDKKSVLRDLYEFFYKQGITLDLAKQIYNQFKEKSLDILKTNPYELCGLRGMDFIKTDGIAHKIMSDISNDKRILACIKSILNKSDGSLCMPYIKLKDEVINKINESISENNLPKPDMNKVVESIPIVIRTNLNIFTAIKDISDEKKPITYVYLRNIFEKEKYVAQNLYHRIYHEKRNLNLENKDIEEAEKDISEFNNRAIVLDEDQKNAIRSAFEHKITVITGGGGSGKSTICRCIYHLASEKGLSVRMMSPTGKAAQVLTEKTGFHASTIHRGLKMIPATEYPREKINEDIILVDEISMVGIDTMFAIMYALEKNLWGHLVFVGDSNQLPSVSPGNFLSDIMSSGCANVVRLNKIHRQDENSYIPLLANDIAKGKVVDIPEDASDIKWHNLGTEDFAEKIQDVVSEFLKTNKIEDLQIIAPMYRGNFGVSKINSAIQDLMTTVNASIDKFIVWEKKKFYIGDRVIQIENNYDKNIFNGDMGVIKELGKKALNPSINDKKEEYVIVDFNGEELLYVEEEINQLQLAWVLTIHKYQGSQSPYIILILSNEAIRMFTKELLYTAMTRCSRHLDIYGHKNAFYLAPTKSAIKKRYTNTKNIINEIRENRHILLVMGNK